jgi:hypothetical protein
MGKGPSLKRCTKANDVEWDISGVENPKLAKMEVATKIWPAPNTKLKHLKRLHQQRLLPE